MQTLDEKLKTYEPISKGNLYGLVGEINTNGYDMLNRKIKKGGFGGGWGKPKKYKSSCGGFTYVKPINGGGSPDYYPKPKTGFGPKTGSKPFNVSKNTAYAPLSHGKNFKVGITHHGNGLGKLKIFDNSRKKSYGVPLIDIHKKPLKKWRY